MSSTPQLSFSSLNLLTMIVKARRLSPDLTINETARGRVSTNSR